MISSPTASFNEELRLIEPILYGDVFDHALTLDEIWRFCPLPLTREEIAAGLSGDGNGSPAASLVACRQGYYHLLGREELIPIRRERLELSRTIWKRAHRVVSVIQYVPFIRMVAVTGSLANDNAGEDGDPDFLIVTARNRIWTVFCFLGTLQRLTSTHVLCPNFYLSEDHLLITPQDYYNAREVVQAIPLYGMDHYHRFLEANSWVRRYYPNRDAPARRPEQEISPRFVLEKLKQACESAAGGWLGDRLEALLKRMLLHRLRHHYRCSGGEPPEEVMDNAIRGRELRFHGLRHRSIILEAVRKRIAKVEQELDGKTAPS